MTQDNKQDQTMSMKEYGELIQKRNNARAKWFQDPTNREAQNEYMHLATKCDAEALKRSGQ